MYLLGRKDMRNPCALIMSDLLKKESTEKVELHSELIIPIAKFESGP